MEALQLLVDMVKDLPDLAIWVILAFFIYKTLIVGSIFGVIKLTINRICDTVDAWKRKPVDSKLFDDLCMDRGVEKVLAQQLRRLTNTAYLHRSNINTLREALDAHFEKGNRSS